MICILLLLLLLLLLLCYCCGLLFLMLHGVLAIIIVLISLPTSSSSTLLWDGPPLLPASGLRGGIRTPYLKNIFLIPPPEFENPEFDSGPGAQVIVSIVASRK